MKSLRFGNDVSVKGVDLERIPVGMEMPIFVELRDRGYRDYAAFQLPMPGDTTQVLSLARLRSREPLMPCGLDATDDDPKEEDGFRAVKICRRRPRWRRRRGGTGVLAVHVCPTWPRRVPGGARGRTQVQARDNT